MTVCKKLLSIHKKLQLEKKVQRMIKKYNYNQAFINESISLIKEPLRM